MTTFGGLGAGRNCVALALALGLGGCLELEGVDYVIDLASQTGRVTIHGIGSDGTVGGIVDDSQDATEADDFKSLMDDYARGDSALAGLASGLGFKTWQVQARRLVDAGARLDGEIAFGFAGPADLHLASYDRARPYLWCPPEDLHVVRANASFRTREGCLVWSAAVKTLRIELQKTHAGKVRSLLARWRATR